MKKWQYLKQGDTVQEGDLWCGVHGDNPHPYPAYCIGDKVTKENETGNCYMRLRVVNQVFFSPPIPSQQS